MTYNAGYHHDFYMSPKQQSASPKRYQLVGRAYQQVPAEDVIHEESSLSNFVCCGVYLADLHALLKHYEDQHIRFATEDGTSYYGTSRGRKVMAMDIEPCDFLPGNSEEEWGAVSAFDNTILRTVNPGHFRSHSAPVRSSQLPQQMRGMPPQLMASQNDQSRLIQSILSSTTIDPSLAEQPHGPNSKEHGRRDRPYVCPVPGCGKSYKNPNGLKYHTSHGHDGTELVVERPHKCPISNCGKKYKNPNGLKYHMAHVHQMTRHGNALTKPPSKKSGASSSRRHYMDSDSESNNFASTK